MATIVRVLHSLRPVVMALLGCVLAAAAHADAGRRVALVIGNGGYQNAPALPNPASDARALAESLRGLSFEVIEAEDLDQPDMLARLDEFAGKLKGADTGLFFYAGHGLQVAGENYLVPVDARLQREAQVPLQTVPLAQVLARMEAAVPTRIVILDACRDNPIAQTLKRGLAPGTGAGAGTSVGQGLAEVRAAAGTLIAYATGPGDTAADGSGPHSPFTAALLDHIATPGLEVRQVLGRVREEVLQQTGERQVPWDSSSLRGEFYFKAGEPLLNLPPPSEVQPMPEMRPEDRVITPDKFDVREADLSFWNAIASSRKRADYDAYLQAFPNGMFAGLARSRVEDLRAPPATERTEKASPAVQQSAQQTELQKPQEAKPPQQPAVTAALEPEVVEPPGARIEAALGLSREDWRQVQHDLASLGFGTGVADGKPGQMTRKALAKWQKSKKIKATGYLSSQQREMIQNDARAKAEIRAAEQSKLNERRDIPKVQRATAREDAIDVAELQEYVRKNPVVTLYDSVDVFENPENGAQRLMSLGGSLRVVGPIDSGYFPVQIDGGIGYVDANRLRAVGEFTRGRL
ncbi:MAG: caspase family protein [Geminicoccaceae bacterium]